MPRFIVIVFSVLFSALLVAAQNIDSVFADHPSTAPSVDSEPALEIYVTLTDKLFMGQTDAGERAIVPITGGYFRGEGIQGIVLPGGADWQLIRRDGVQEIVAQYAIQTDNGSIIQVDNRGISFTDEGDRYRLTAPKFHAPEGQHDWLNKTLFVGTITSIAEPRAVIIRAYKLEE
jgi:hypothetical protein